MVVQSEDYSCKVSGSSTGADRFLTSSVRVLKSSTKAAHLFPVRFGDMVTVSGRTGSPGAARSLWKDADLDTATQINLMFALLGLTAELALEARGPVNALV
jgi:thiamine monophosphate kinase